MKFLSQNFELDFMSDEEVTDALDGIVFTVGEAVLEDDNKTAILSENKYKQMQFTYAVLKYLTKGSGASLSYKLHQPFKSMGSITIEGNELTFGNAEWFSRAAEFASNVDIYPLTNGKVRMTFTFHGLTTPIE